MNLINQWHPKNEKKNQTKGIKYLTFAQMRRALVKEQIQEFEKYGLNIN